jgi:hypothetical protein
VGHLQVCSTFYDPWNLENNMLNDKLWTSWFPKTQATRRANGMIVIVLIRDGIHIIRPTIMCAKCRRNGRMRLLLFDSRFIFPGCRVCWFYYFLILCKIFCSRKYVW